MSSNTNTTTNNYTTMPDAFAADDHNTAPTTRTNAAMAFLTYLRTPNTARTPPPLPPRSPRRRPSYTSRSSLPASPPAPPSSSPRSASSEDESVASAAVTAARPPSLAPPTQQQEGDDDAAAAAAHQHQHHPHHRRGFPIERCPDEEARMQRMAAYFSVALEPQASSPSTPHADEEDDDGDDEYEAGEEGEDADDGEEQHSPDASPAAMTTTPPPPSAVRAMREWVEVVVRERAHWRQGSGSGSGSGGVSAEDEKKKEQEGGSAEEGKEEDDEQHAPAPQQQPLGRFAQQLERAWRRCLLLAVLRDARVWLVLGVLLHGAVDCAAARSPFVSACASLVHCVCWRLVSDRYVHAVLAAERGRLAIAGDGHRRQRRQQEAEDEADRYRRRRHAKREFVHHDLGSESDVSGEGQQSENERAGDGHRGRKTAVPTSLRQFRRQRLVELAKHVRGLMEKSE